MRFAIIVLAVFIFGSCNQPIVSNRHRSFEHLLSKFKTKDFDTLEVYSPLSDTGEYAGIPIDSNDARLFPTVIADAYFQEPGNVFAIYKFNISNAITALIARTPSEYYPTSIKLFFYDSKMDSITNFVELSEEFGDAGDAFSKRSWLIKGNKKTLALVSTLEAHDHSVDDANDTTVENIRFDYLIDLTKGKADTINTNQAELQKMFRSRL